MGPEDLRDVISAYQTCVAKTVGRFGGFVAKYMGDGVLVYFGYPQAHEDDAERAVRAGLVCKTVRKDGGGKRSVSLSEARDLLRLVYIERVDFGTSEREERKKR
jgi:class 3 adenylate cyclase